MTSNEIGLKGLKKISLRLYITTITKSVIIFELIPSLRRKIFKKTGSSLGNLSVND